jgi:ABC-2 type transport system permease protein
MMRAMRAVTRKEVLEIRRDPITIAVAALLPVVMLFLFGSALSLDVKDAPYAVYDLDKSAHSRDLVAAFDHSGYFRRVREIDSDPQIGRLLDGGAARLVLVIPPDFSRRILRGETAPLQALVDGSFSATAMVIAGYATAIAQDFSLRHARLPSGEAGAGGAHIGVEGRVWFNAPLKSVYYIVPGLFGVILMAFPPLLTALALVREKESGSVHQIFVSPVAPWQFVLAKALPYMVIAFLQMALILFAGLLWFGVPFRGSLALFLAATALYVMCTVGLGLLVSTIAHSQLVAMLLAIMVTLMPAFLFSGFLFPIFTMPEMMQWYTYLFPARYFVEISRAIVMKGTGVVVWWPQLIALAVYTVVVFAGAALAFRKRVA